MLSPGSGGAEDLHLDVLLPDIHINIRLDIRHDIAGHKGGLALPLCIKGGDPDQTVNPGLRAKIAVGVVPVDLHRDGLDPRLLSLQIVQDLYAKAPSLRPAGIHAVEHPRPVIRLRTARSGV